MSGEPRQVGAQLTAHYEAVRAQALGSATPGTTALGLALVLRRGMVAWLAVCGEVLARQPGPSVRSRAAPQTVAPGVQGEAVRLLAGMALAVVREGDL